MERGLSLLHGKVQSWLEVLVAGLPNFVVAVIVVVAFWLFSKAVRRVLDRVFTRTAQESVVGKFLSTTLALGVFVLGLVAALGILNLNKTVTSILAGAGIVGLALGLAFQSIASNLLAGILISVRKPFVLGELIETQSHLGRVESLNLRSTVIRTLDGKLVFVPNEKVLDSPIINYSRTGVRRVELSVGVSYGDDLESVRGVVLEALQALPVRLGDRDVELFFEEFGSSSINFVARFWIAFSHQSDYLEARSLAIMAIRKAFGRAGITIPFPIRTLDFGIKGGATLADVLGPAGRPMTPNRDDET